MVLISEAICPVCGKISVFTLGIRTNTNQGEFARTNVN